MGLKKLKEVKNIFKMPLIRFISPQTQRVIPQIKPCIPQTISAKIESLFLI
jgi:hypothetical protein